MALAAAGILVLLPLLASLAAATPPGPHIADLNILLPPRTSEPVGYRLQGSGGCFSWSWDHHDILSLKPEFNGSSRCSTSARLSSIAPYARRKETAVYATDVLSGITIRCKVFIDRISRIQIFHHAVKIDLDELATLRIRAFDDEENVFSSLVGLKFLWQLDPKSSEDTDVHCLVHVPLKETPLSDCGGFCGDLDFQIDLEDRGFGSDLYVVKGTKIGHEVVSAKLLEPQLEHVVDRIVLTVAEAMSLDPPSPVFATVGALIYYTLRVIRSNTPQVVDLPSPHHQWSVTNSSVADVEFAKGWVYALELGITSIVVEDTRLSGHVQTSSLHVVFPDRLSLYLLPLSRGFNLPEETKPVPSSVVWYVFPGQVYIIHMKAFSQGPDANEIYITENNDLKLESSTDEYWDIYSGNDVFSTLYDRRKSRLLKPTSEGRGVLTASLSYYSSKEKEWTVLRDFQDVIVCSKVKFLIGEDEFSQIIRLPWAPGVCQEVELKATGGCVKNLEDYVWFSSDEAIVSVSTSGLLRAKKPGKAVIKVVSVYDSINYDEVLVEVSIPSSMVVLQNFPVEVVIGTKFHVTVALKTSDGEFFFRCDSFNSLVRWKVFSESETFKVLNESMDFNAIQDSELLQGHPCAQTYLYASAAGRAVLHATLSIELQSHLTLIDGPVTLKASSSLAAYSPLVVHQAESGNKFGGYWIDLGRIRADYSNAEHTRLHDLYLAPGSAMDILLLGGPEQWDQHIDYIETVEITSEQSQSITDGVLVQQTPSRLYTVLCQALGKFKLLFSRGNLAGDGHRLPAVAYAELSIVCSFPSSITLIANEPVNRLDIIEATVKADRSPDRIRTSPVVVANGCTIRIAAVGIHMTGRSFANSSSLCLRWELNNCEELAHWNGTESFESSSWERYLVLHNTSGQCTVRATLDGFAKAMASHLFEKEHLFGSTDKIPTDAIHLQLVSTLRITPEFVLLVFDPEAKVNLSVTGGTRFLDAVTNDTLVADLSQPPEIIEFSYLVLSAKGLGVATVTVQDIGLSPPAVASALVKVANVDWIKIISEEEISLMEGAIHTFDILAGTQDGSVFDSSQYEFMNTHVHLDDGILELVSVNSSPRFGGWIISKPHFTVRAALLGIATLYVSVTQRNGHEVFSQIIKVEVYKPLRLHPEYVYLAPGASYVLTVKGGPRVAFVEYASMHEETATIQGSSGRLSAISTGNATVRARVFGNERNLICEAYGRVQVGIPSTMFLNLQSDRLCIGCKMPVFPSFPEGNLFSFYELCYDYKWAAEKEKVLSYQRSGYLYSDVDKVSISCAEGTDNPCLLDDNDSEFVNVLVGRSAGRTEVSVSFSCSFVSSGTGQVISYNTSKTLTVVPDPPLALGIPITWLLPPFYTTSDLLPGSSDSHANINPRDRKRSTSYSLLKAYGRSDISKQDAVAIEGSKIRTKESNELACIQAKDHTTGRMEIASCVRVAEVAQVRAVKTGSLYHVAYLALHAKLELLIGYCDELGYTFSEAHGVVSLDVETNYPDIVSIHMPNGNNTNSLGGYGNVFLEARSPGKALVMVTINDNPKKADFILVSVGGDVYPRNPVVQVGHKLNFTIIGDGKGNLASGQWLSSNESVLSVNRMSGEVHAHTEGSAQVIFKGSNWKLQTTVNVLKVDQITVDSPGQTLTNVPFPLEGYKFAITFSALSGSEVEASRGPVEVLYDCRVDPPYLGYAKPWSDLRSSNSYCLFFPYSPNHLVTSISESKKAMSSEENSRREGFMHVSIIASLREAPQVTGSAHALFVGGFSVDEVEEIKLTPNSNKSIIRVIGNTDVELYWRSKDLLLVTPCRRVGFGIGGVTEYEVEVLRNQNFTDKLMIVLPSTGQQKEIYVSFEHHGEEKNIESVVAGKGFFVWSALGMCIVVSTIFVFIWLLGRPQYRTVAPSPRLGTPIASPSHVPTCPPSVHNTPTSSAAANINQSSPCTPQPFVEYIRRTIDETPYYKRSRRRFDPQYTY